jgi:hypothetical protein
MDIINQVLLRSFLILLCVGSAAGVLLGVGMLLKPDFVASLNQRLSRWVGTEKIEEHFDRPRWVERMAYRHHRLVGGVLFAGALFILYTFVFTYNVRRISAAIPTGSWRLMDVLVGLLIIGSVVAALVGIIILAKPSLLRDVEKSTNSWVSTDGALTFFNKMRNQPEAQMLRYRKAVGVFFIVGSLYTLFVVGGMLATNRLI